MMRLIPAIPLVALAIALSAAGLTLVARALIPLFWRDVKPWSCDLCMSWWGGLAATLLLLAATAAVGVPYFAVAFTASIPLAVLILSAVALSKVEKVEVEK
jgi:hypothetical protein